MGQYDTPYEAVPWEATIPNPEKKKEKKKKLCPLKWETWCYEEACAFWTNRVPCCAIVEIAIHLRIRTQDNHGSEW